MHKSVCHCSYVPPVVDCATTWTVKLRRLQHQCACWREQVLRLTEDLLQAAIDRLDTAEVQVNSKLKELDKLENEDDPVALQKFIRSLTVNQDEEIQHAAALETVMLNGLHDSLLVSSDNMSTDRGVKLTAMNNSSLHLCRFICDTLHFDNFVEGLPSPVMCGWGALNLLICSGQPLKVDIYRTCMEDSKMFLESSFMLPKCLSKSTTVSDAVTFKDTMYLMLTNSADFSPTVMSVSLPDGEILHQWPRYSSHLCDDLTEQESHHSDNLYRYPSLTIDKNNGMLLVIKKMVNSINIQSLRLDDLTPAAPQSAEFHVRGMSQSTDCVLGSYGMYLWACNGLKVLHNFYPFRLKKSNTNDLTVGRSPHRILALPQFPDLHLDILLLRGNYYLREKYPVLVTMNKEGYLRCLSLPVIPFGDAPSFHSFRVACSVDSGGNETILFILNASTGHLTGFKLTHKQ